MVKVNLDIAYAAADHLRDTVEQVAPILLLRVKEAVLWRLTVDVLWGIGRDARPTVAPASHSAEGGLHGRSQAQGLIVIRYRNPDAPRGWFARTTPESLLHIGQEPELSMSWKLHR
jgi:hypothetical protein